MRRARCRLLKTPTRVASEGTGAGCAECPRLGIVIHNPLVARQFLLLSGLPGAGKTHYACELERRGWLRLSSDQWQLADPRVISAWHGVLTGSDNAVYSLTSAVAGIVVEWGFHTNDLPKIEAIARRGHCCWYLDGDREAALEAWRRRWQLTMPDSVWTAQADRLAAAAERIRAIYGDRIIRTVCSGPAGPVHMPPDELFARMGIGT